MLSPARRGSARIPIVLLTALLLIAVPLAGCTGSSGPSDAVPTADDGDETDTGDETDDGNATDGTGDNGTVPATTTRLTLAGCNAQQAVFVVPAAVAEGQMPEGFGPADPFGTGGATTALVAVGISCKNATSDGFADPVEGFGSFVAFLAVDPPDEYEDPDVDNYLLQVATVTSTEEVRSVYEDWNLSAEEGSVSLSVTGVSPGARKGTVDVQGEDVQATIHTAVQAQTRSEADFRVRTFGIVNGTVTDVVDIAVTGSTFTDGVSKLELGTPPTDADDLQFWALFSPMSGIATHYVDASMTIDMTRRPASAFG